MKDNTLNKKENRETMLQKAKQLAQQKATDRDFHASKAGPPRSDDREPEVGENVPYN